MPKSHSTFPFNPPLSGSGGGGAGAVLQALYSRAETDIAIASTTVATLVALMIEVQEGSRLAIAASVSGSMDAGTLEYNVFLDAVSQTGGLFDGAGEATALFLSEPLSAGVHTVTIEAQAVGGNASIAAASSADREHAQLFVLEIAA